MRCTWSMLVAVVILAAARGAAGDTVIFEESLKDMSANDSGHCGFVHNGQFVSGTGWQTTVLDSRIRFDLPYDVACGTLEVDFTNFDPINNFRGDCGNLGDPGAECYVNTIGLYEGTHGNNWDAATGGHSETQIQVQASCEQCFDDHPGDLGRDHHFKFKGMAWATWDTTPEQGSGFNAYLPPDNSIDWAGNMSSLFTATFSWNCTAVGYTLKQGADNWTDSGGWSWNGDPGDQKPHIRYIFVGKDYSGGDKWITNVIYTRVKVSEQNPCDCPGTAPDAGVPDAGVDAGHHRDVGVDAGIAEDSGIAKDIGSRDTGLPADGSAGPDSGTSPDTGQPWDTGPFTDAGHHPDDAAVERDAGRRPDSGAVGVEVDEESVGCSCASLTH